MHFGCLLLLIIPGLPYYAQGGHLQTEFSMLNIIVTLSSDPPSPLNITLGTSFAQILQ